MHIVVSALMSSSSCPSPWITFTTTLGKSREQDAEVNIDVVVLYWNTAGSESTSVTFVLTFSSAESFEDAAADDRFSKAFHGSQCSPRFIESFEICQR
jgi:hypothetical protein